MFFRNPAKPEIIVEAPADGATPKAVVVLMGWFGSKLRHVRKYSELYEQRGCATVTGCIDSLSVMLLDMHKIDEFTGAIVHEAAKLLRLGDEIPLVCHVFSNGGGIPLHRMEEVMVEKSQAGSSGDKDVEDWKLIKERLNLGAEIFDSAPAFPDFETYRGALNAALPNPVVASFAFFLFGAYFRLIEFIAYLSGKTNWAVTYWSHWEGSPAHSPVQSFIYSTADSITKSSKLDELCKIREAKGVRVIAKRFDDSGHVQHLLAHRKEYCAVIDTVLVRTAK